MSVVVLNIRYCKIYIISKPALEIQTVTCTWLASQFFCFTYIQTSVYSNLGRFQSDSYITDIYNSLYDFSLLPKNSVI